MTTYTAIADSDIDPESPGTTTLFTRLRDNPLAIAEGDASAPDIALAAVAGLTDNITGFTRANVTYIDDEGDSQGVLLGIASFSSSWESVGPTGSGATNIWTALNNLPSDTVYVNLGFYLNVLSTGSTCTVSARINGSSAASGTYTMCATCPALSTGSNVSYCTKEIPVSSRMFDLRVIGAPANGQVQLVKAVV